MKPKQFVGLVIVLLAALVIVLIPRLRTAGRKILPVRPTAITLSGKVGGEKMAFLRNPQVLQILKDRYGIEIVAQRAGSVALVTEPPTGQQFLWPANEMQVEIFRKTGGQDLGVEDVFNSPLVIYTWRPVVDALVTAGVVKKEEEIFYVDDFGRLIGWVSGGKRWKEVGLPQLYGKMMITSTDPQQSNSGMSFAGLVANQMNRGEVVTVAEIDTLLPRVVRFFRAMGFLEQSSGTLFEKYLNQGLGSYPLMIGYENQIVEFTLEHPEYAQKIKQEVVVLYPRPTTWASHPLIALDKNARRLTEALKTDRDLQKIALERHGFRSALLNDPRILASLGLPQQITAVQQLPSYEVMTRILGALGNP